MSDINAAPSSTKPTADAAPMTAAELAALPDWIKNGQPPAQEAGAAASGETSGIPAIPSNSGSNVNTAASNITSMTASTDGAGDATGTTSTDAPAVAASGEGPGSAAHATFVSNAAVSVDAGTAAADAGNAGASPADGQPASDTASSVQDALKGGDTAVDALRAEIASLQQQLTDEQANVAKWQGLYNAATAAREPGAPAPAHRWISLLEVKLSALEHDARDELLDVARQLREAL